MRTAVVTDSTARPVDPGVAVVDLDVVVGDPDVRGRRVTEPYRPQAGRRDGDDTRDGSGDLTDPDRESRVPAGRRQPPPSVGLAR